MKFDPTPYKCILPGCRKEFSKNSSLTVHMLAHAKNNLLIAEKVNHKDFGARAPNIRVRFRVPTVADGIKQEPKE